jgi:hypothetical protein
MSVMRLPVASNHSAFTMAAGTLTMTTPPFPFTPMG